MECTSTREHCQPNVITNYWWMMASLIEIRPQIFASFNQIIKLWWEQSHFLPSSRFSKCKTETGRTSALKLFRCFRQHSLKTSNLSVWYCSFHCFLKSQVHREVTVQKAEPLLRRRTICFSSDSPTVSWSVAEFSWREAITTVEISTMCCCPYFHFLRIISSVMLTCMVRNFS